MTRSQLNFDLDPEKKRLFRAALAARGETVKDVLMRTVDAVISGTSGTETVNNPPKALPKPPSDVIKDKRIAELLAVFQEVAASGIPEALNSLEHGVSAAHAVMRYEQKLSGQTPSHPTKKPASGGKR